jgi:uncharacterized damage-inducible protein DinB
MQLAELNHLYRHMEWADASVWRAVQLSANAQGDQKLRELFYHLHLVQHAFLRAWRGEPPDTPYPTFDNCDSLMRWGQAYYPEVCAHLANLTDAEASTTMQLPWAEIVERELGRKPAEISFAETMLQVPLHSQYHRGQINARLREVGGEPPRVDYIVWVWLGRPGADWSFFKGL